MNILIKNSLYINDIDSINGTYLEHKFSLFSTDVIVMELCTNFYS